ncbi:unnamed protein product [Closterium sp. Yama58-4]|nr:unnamed protein product [Closterium sp. Yama58-4]
MRPGCVNKYQCPTRETKQCGVFYNCMPGSTASIAKASITTCGSCSYNDPKNAFTSVCNYEYGRCVPNTIDGKTCTADAQCTAPGVTGFTCRPDQVSARHVRRSAEASQVHKCMRGTNQIHRPSSPAIMLPSVAVALVLLAASIPASDAQVRPGCIRKYQCPRRGSLQCGLYYVCSDSANPKPPYTLQTCDTCAFRDNVKAYTQVCNYLTGRCNKNLIDGKPCATDAQCGTTGEFKCLVNKNSKAKPKSTRCCRTKCPPGLCGAYVAARRSNTVDYPRRWNQTISIVRSPPSKTPVTRLRVSARIQVDRRKYLEELFRRQLEEEKRRAESAVTCPVDCVREVRTMADLEAELLTAENNMQLVVVDFYNSSCGSCKYILPKFIDLCKSGCQGDSECTVDGFAFSDNTTLDKVTTDGITRNVLPAAAEESKDADAVDSETVRQEFSAVRFLKHNVRDDYDDLTEIALLYRIKLVPAFAFFKDGSCIGQISTRNTSRVAAALATLLSGQKL